MFDVETNAISAYKNNNKKGNNAIDNAFAHFQDVFFKKDACLNNKIDGNVVENDLFKIGKNRELKGD